MTEPTLKSCANLLEFRVFDDDSHGVALKDEVLSKTSKYRTASHNLPELILRKPAISSEQGLVTLVLMLNLPFTFDVRTERVDFL